MRNFKKTGSLTDLNCDSVRNRTVRILNTASGVLESKNGDEYNAISVEFVYTDAKNPVAKTKQKAIWTNEARLIIESGPFSSAEEYIVTLGYEGKYQVWTDIRPADKEVA